ncbi:MAG: HlyD family efflux transporter periplasmic adaptor subunit [Bacteroidota bacterium]
MERNYKVLEEDKSFITRPPNWFIRYGLTLLGCTFAGLFAFIATVEYADTILTSAEITQLSPNIRLVSATAGKIDTLFSPNESPVKKGELLAVLSSRTSWKEVLELEQYLKKPDSIGVSRLPTYAHLGTLEAVYAPFVNASKEYLLTSDSRLHERQLQSLDIQHQNTLSLIQYLEQQKKKMGQQKEIVQKNFDRNQSLHEGAVVSDLVLEEKEVALLQARQKLDDLDMQVVLSQTELEKLELEKRSLKEQRKVTLAQRMMQVEKTEADLISAIQRWKETYLIYAPVSGTLAWCAQCQAQQFVQQGQEVVTIIPDGPESTRIATAFLPSLEVSKIRKDMSVRIQVDGFPRFLHGEVKGVVSQISLVPEKVSGMGKYYAVQFSLPQNLTTSHGKTIPFRQEMQAQAHIMLDKKPLLHRLLEKILVD